jgi:predicted nucleic acid-binding Zn ribbon protein
MTLEHDSNITKAGCHFCDSCGEPINPVRKWHRFCSHKCQVRKWRKVKHGSSEDEILKERLCHYCALSFKPTRKWQKFCSVQCQVRSYRKQRIPTFENAADVEDYIVRLIRAMNRHSKRIASYREFKFERWQPRKSTR